MPLDEFRSQLQERSLDLSWSCWASLGLSASQSRDWSTVIDPEALVLLTITASRTDTRLFEEMADWMLSNERLISFRRLRSLSDQPEDKRLVQGLTQWMRANGSKSQRQTNASRATESQIEDLARESRLPVRNPDPSFLDAGFLTEEFPPSGLSGHPDLMTPAALAFRLRLTLGIGIRSELVRVLLSSRDQRWLARDLAKAVGYSKRNVLDSLGDLEAVGLITLSSTQHEGRYEVVREPWEGLLALNRSEMSSPFDWVSFSSALRAILNWSWTEVDAGADRYLLASSAGQLLARNSELNYLTPTGKLPLPGDPDYWSSFTDQVLKRIDELTAR